MTRLTDMKTGSRPVLAAIDGGIGVETRLREMGFVPGERIRVLQNTGHGPVTVDVKGSRVAIGHGLARKIWIKEEENQDG